ncbi:MAG TPA: TetR/AcrR family transcriptional regulator [Bacteroidales bacterium]|nr:TetR/AcrR family transcriptional regulator [Bacteroidales bacterium]
MNNENGIAIKDAILKAAQEIFSKYGYKKTTLDDIARYIGKGKSALYYYYKNKEQIFEAVLAFEVTQLRDELFNELDAAKDPQDKLRRYILKRMELYHNLVNYYGAIQQEYLENLSVIERIRKQYDDQELEMISDIIKEGVARGIFVSKNITLTAGAIIMAMKGFEYSFSKEKDLQKLGNDINQLLDILFYGIVSGKK